MPLDKWEKTIVLPGPKMLSQKGQFIHFNYKKYRRDSLPKRKQEAASKVERTPLVL